MLRNCAKSWKDLEEDFNWHEDYLRDQLKRNEEMKSEWSYLHMHIPQLFPLIEKPNRASLLAYTKGTFLEDIHQVLKPFTNNVTRCTTYNGVPYWTFDLTVAGRLMYFFLFLSDVEKYCTKKVKVKSTTSKTVTYEGCLDIWEELAGMEED